MAKKYITFTTDAQTLENKTIVDGTLTGNTTAENLTISGELTMPTGSTTEFHTLDITNEINVPTPTSDTNAITKLYCDTEIAKAKMGSFRFIGYIKDSEPTNAKSGDKWYASNVLPTVFPIQVHTFDGTSWSATTEAYTPINLDMWANLIDDHGYYWFGNGWNKIDSVGDILVDNTTIEFNGSNQLALKDSGITKAKANSEFWTDNALTGSTTTQNLTISNNFEFNEASGGSMELEAMEITEFLNVPTPINNANATPKTYVDTQDALKVDKVSTANKVYGTDSSGNQTTFNKDDLGGKPIIRVFALPSTQKSGYIYHLISDEGGYSAGFYVYNGEWVRTSIANVDNSTIQINSSNNLEVKDSGITSAKILDGAITSGKIVNGSIGNAKLESLSVSNDKIQDNTITNGKLADLTIQNGKIANSTIEVGKLANVGIANSGKVLKVNSNGDFAVGDIEAVEIANTSTITNYINPNSARCTIQSGSIVKMGDVYSMKVVFRFTTGKATWAANTEWLNLFTTTSAFQAINKQGFQGTIRDAINGNYGGAVNSSGGGTIGLWPWKQISTSTLISTDFTLVATWVSK